MGRVAKTLRFKKPYLRADLTSPPPYLTTKQRGREHQDVVKAVGFTKSRVFRLTLMQHERNMQ